MEGEAKLLLCVGSSRILVCFNMKHLRREREAGRGKGEPSASLLKGMRSVPPLLLPSGRKKNEIDFCLLSGYE